MTIDHCQELFFHLSEGLIYSDEGLALKMSV